MRLLARCAIGVAILSVPAIAEAQITTAEPYKTFAGQVQEGIGVTIVAPIRATSTSAAGSVATANTFQNALAASSSRKGCAIYNTSAAVELVYLGAPVNATAAAAIPIPAGGSFNCGSFQGLVLTDQISITSTLASATYVAVSQ